MVGNDVVDLGDAEARPGTRHLRFDVRVFTPAERRRIEDAEAGDCLRWILWAAKESAYKVAKRRDPACVFSPSRFVVELDAGLRGRVRHAGEAFPVHVTRHGDFVHAVAAEPGGEPDRAFTGVRRLAAAPQAEADASRRPGRSARAFALREIAARLAVAPDSLRIARRRRIPRLLHGDGREAGGLSLSHHGRFVAYAFVPRPLQRERVR